MNTKKATYLLVFCFVIVSSGLAHAATEDTRYLVKSSSNFWKKSFGVRYQFDGGFTTDLADWQLRVAKVFGVEVVPVKKFYVLADEEVASPSPTVSPVPSPTPEPLKDKDKTDTGSIKGRPSPAPVRPVPASQLPWGIKAVYGNNPLLVKTSGGEGVNVAVLDTGILKTHSDLKNRIIECKDFTNAKKPIVDGVCDDKNGHGTHVAGTIAADGGDDGLGIYGIAPEANLFAYRVCGSNGSCWSDDIAMALREATDSGANVVNLSLGSDSQDTLIASAILYAIGKNVLVVAAAGNDGPDLGSIDYPGANPNVIAVGAFDVTSIIPEWSSRGKNSTDDPKVIEEGDIEFAAPGVIVESTWKDGGYVILSGTSMATPHIAGLVAKFWQKDAADPDSATRNILHGFAQDLLPPGDDDASGFGFPHL